MDEFTLPPGWQKMEASLGPREAGAWAKIPERSADQRTIRILRVYEPKKGKRYVAESWSRPDGWVKLGAFEHPLVAMLALEVELAG